MDAALYIKDHPQFITAREIPPMGINIKTGFFETRSGSPHKTPTASDLSVVLLFIVDEQYIDGSGPRAKEVPGFRYRFFI